MSAANFMVSTSSSTSSDDFQAQRRGGKKRKWKDFFEKLMRDVVEKQEELQTKFLRTIEIGERERSLREESWRMQEMARLNREHEIFVQERSAAAAKDAAVIAFLQKISGQQPQSPQNQPPQPKQNAPPLTLPETAKVILLDQNGGGDHNKVMMVCSNNNNTPPNSSRWPKAEVEALIKLRTNFEIKNQENGLKGPFWEEISAGMQSLGYTRNAKRCKEKWENINKYFKKVKESNKQRPEDSKTCPYYHLLNAIYKEKKGGSNGGGEEYNNHVQLPGANSLMEPLMVQPEQQWPLTPHTLAHQNLNEEEEQDDMLDEDELDQDIEDEEDDDEVENNNNNNNGGTFGVVNNNNPQHGSPSSAASTGSIGTAVA